LERRDFAWTGAPAAGSIPVANARTNIRRDIIGVSSRGSALRTQLRCRRGVPLPEGNERARRIGPASLLLKSLFLWAQSSGSCSARSERSEEHTSELQSP